MSLRTLLIDGDGIAYPASATSNPGVWAVSRVRALQRELGAGRVIVALGDAREQYFRRQLWPAYKAKRRPPPAGVDHALTALHESFMSRTRPGLEADDVLGILATCESIEGERIVVGNDKDLLTIPGLHHRLGKDGPDRRVRVAPAVADRKHLAQALAGDSGDGYPGCPGIGEARAADILAGDHAPLWPRVVLAYQAAGLTEADALLQARLARILRAEDYDLAGRTVRPWSPPPHLRTTEAA